MAADAPPTSGVALFERSDRRALDEMLDDAPLRTCVRRLCFVVVFCCRLRAHQSIADGSDEPLCDNGSSAGASLSFSFVAVAAGRSFDNLFRFALVLRR